MRQLLNLNNLLFITILLFITCDNPQTITSCSPNQQLDSCGNCYYSTSDPLWNDCVDPCGIANGQNVCDYENIVIDNCDCSGCMEFGDPNYCVDCSFSNPCECNYALYSHFKIDINPDCLDLNNCNSYEFSPDDIDFNIRERCGLLTNINSDYTIEKLENINITSRDPAPPSLKYLKASGGIYRDMTIHDFDLVRFYLGKDRIKEVFASASNFVNKKLKKIKEYEISTCVLKSNSGVIAVINNSRHCSFGMDQRVEIFGTKGMLISGNRRIDETESYLKSSTGSKKSFLNFFIERYGPSYKLQLNSLASFFLKKSKPRANFDDGEKSLIIANAAYKSLNSRKVVKIK